MRYRTFGKTGLKVSELSLGTVQQGVEQYGLYAPGEPLRAVRRESISLLLRAFESGVNLVDTSPGYGEAEEVLGEALASWGEPVIVATKVSCDVPEGQSPGDAVRESLETSLRRLQRDQLDVVQLANATTEDLMSDDLIGALVEARDRGLIAHIGASVYGPQDALAAVAHESIAVVQVAFNLIDQRARREVFSQARERGVAVILRSALLKGVLTSRRRHLPERLSALQEAADRAERWARKNGDDLTGGALRFCLAQREVGSVLVGVRDTNELDTAMDAAGAEPLHSHRLANADRLALDDESLIDPRHWGIP